MAIAKLHIICGNCGCNDMFTYRTNLETDDDTDEPYSLISISCKNCSTLHDLSDNAKEEIQ